MLTYTKDGFIPHTHVVHFTDNGSKGSQTTNDVEYWKRAEERWSDFVIDNVMKIEWTDEQLERLEEVKHMPESFTNKLIDYVRNGKFDTEGMPVTHPLVILFLKKEKESLGQALAEEKITNIQKDMLLQGLGQEVSSLKIELMKLKGGE